MSLLIVFGKEGRKQYGWNPQQQKSINKAKKIFEKKLAEGYAAFEIFQQRVHDSLSNSQQGQLKTELVSQSTMMGEQIHEFNSRAETIQMTPPMVGG